MSKYGVFSSPYFPAFGLNTERYEVFLIQPECGKIRTRRNFVFRHFSRSEYMDDCETFNETLLPEKEDSYSHLNVEDIADSDDIHAKRVCKDFEKNTYENIMICMFKAIHYC